MALESVIEGDLAVGERRSGVGRYDIGGGGGGVVEDGLGGDEGGGERPGGGRWGEGAEEEVDEEGAVEGCSVWWRS